MTRLLALALAVALAGCQLTRSPFELAQMQRSELYHAHMAGFGGAGGLQ